MLHKFWHEQTNTGKTKLIFLENDSLCINKIPTIYLIACIKFEYGWKTRIDHTKKQIQDFPEWIFEDWYSSLWVIPFGPSFGCDTLRWRLFNVKKKFSKVLQRNSIKVNTSWDRPKSAPYPRLKNSKKTSKCQVLFYSTRKSNFFEKKFFEKIT